MDSTLSISSRDLFWAMMVQRQDAKKASCDVSVGAYSRVESSTRMTPKEFQGKFLFCFQLFKLLASQAQVYLISMYVVYCYFRYLRKVFFRIGFKGGFGNVWKALMDVPEVRISCPPHHINFFSSKKSHYIHLYLYFQGKKDQTLYE